MSSTGSRFWRWVGSKVLCEPLQEGRANERLLRWIPLNLVVRGSECLEPGRGRRHAPADNRSLAPSAVRCHSLQPSFTIPLQKESAPVSKRKSRFEEQVQGVRFVKST